MDRLLAWLGRRLAKYLSTPLPQDARAATSPPEKLAGALEPGDVLLIEGHTRVSAAIKYLTQSTWSHSAIYIGDALGESPAAGEPKVLIEADLRQGEKEARGRLGEPPHPRLYVPRAFDISPSFAIVKPNLAPGFDYRKLHWVDVKAPSPLDPS